MNAPPSASVRASTPATQNATTSASTTVSKRMRNPTVPAVAGSRRLNSGGPNARPTSRAIAQPSITSVMTATAVTSVSSGASSSLVARPWWWRAAPSRLARLS